MNNKQKSPYRALSVILILAVVNVILFWTCVYFDAKVIPDPDALGHPVPIFTAYFIVLMPVIDIVTTAICVIITIVRVKKAAQSDKLQ